MIFGIGTDIVDVDRVAAVFERFGERFPARILTERELEGYRRSKNKLRFLSTRFAAKEAIVKALGTGFRHGVWVRDVGISPDPLGKPEIHYSKRGDALRARLGVGDGYITLSDEAGLVVAFAVLLRSP